MVSSVKIVDVDSLQLDPMNARLHDERSILAIMSSLERFGQQRPIVANKKGVVIAGNGTFQAAKRLGWKKVNAIETELSGNELTAYALADNRSGELAGWDDGKLAKVLKSISEFEVSLVEAAGFDEEEFSRVLEALNPEKETSLGAASHGAGFNKSRESYESNPMKNIVLFLPDNKHENLVANLATLADRFGVKSNSEVIIKLLSDDGYEINIHNQEES